MEYGDMPIQELAGIEALHYNIRILLREIINPILFKMEWLSVLKEKTFMNIICQLLHLVT